MIVDVIVDTVCPWCYVGKARLDKALAMRPDQVVEIGWRPFQLNPTMPPEGKDRHAYLSEKFGNSDGAFVDRATRSIGMLRAGRFRSSQRRRY